MYYQHEYIREGVGMTLPGTYQLDLPQHGMLSSLLIRLSGGEVNPYGQGAHDWRIIDKISKIVILGNSSEIIKSLTGYQVKALEYYDQGVIAPGDWRNYASNTQYEYLLINFGRWYRDTEVGLDLARFNNVQLQITNTATSASFTDLTIAVLACYLRDAPSAAFKGFMRSEEWYRWTTVSDETKYNILPIEHRIRRVVLQCIPPQDSDYLNKCNMSDLMDDIDLTLKTGQIRVYKGGIDDLMRLNYLDQGNPVIVGGALYQLADDGADMSLGRIAYYVGGATSKDNAVANTIPTLEGTLDHGVIKPETYDADHPIQVIAIGLAPFYTGVFRFDDSSDPADWLDPDANQNVKLDLHTRLSSNAVGGTNAIVLDRIVT